MGAEWRETTVGEFSPFAYGRNLPEKKRENGPYRVYGSNGPVGFHNKPLVEESGIVIGRKGTVGAVHYTAQPFWPIDTTFYVSRANHRDLRYTYYLLKSLGLENMNSDSAVPGLSRDAAHARKLLVPELHEQHAIAHILGSLDDKIELNHRMNQTLQAMARAIFKHWFIDFEFPNENGEPYKSSGGETINSPLGPIPKGWRIGRIEDVCEFSYGKALKADKRIQGRIPVYGSNGQIGWHNESLVSGPGIIVGRKGNPGLIHWSKEDFFPIDTTFYVVPRVGKSIMHFLYFALKHVDLPRLSADSAVPGLNRNIAYMQQLVIPTEQLLRDFENRISIIFDLLQTNCWQNQSLSELRDSLLPKLVSGEIRVPVSEKEDDQL